MMFLRKIKFLLLKVELAHIDAALADLDWRFALWLCDRFLRKNPTSVPVVLTRARCYEQLRMPEHQRREVELAYAIDDTFVPGIYAMAHSLLEQNDIAGALRLFSVLKDHPVVRDGVDTALSEICMRQAQAAVACEYQLRSWLSNFDNIRHANGHLFRQTYFNKTELGVAQEHKFWADTLKKSVLVDATVVPTLPNYGGVATNGKKSRRKIGYWGSDFKEHSVRYFSRPLIESHNHEFWEVYVYDDNFGNAEPDAHTYAFRTAVEYFYDTSKLEDDEVVSLIKSHALDVLVDIQGHTSANRMHLWGQRLAVLQITGLAYPPTTGLGQMDYKMIDAHMVSDVSNKYYSERQMIMPESFWCFDPKEEAFYNEVSPYRRRGYVTFASMGNAAKITKELMSAWGNILAKVPNSRLLVVSHAFGNALTETSFLAHMRGAGVDVARVECCRSFPRDELWERYSEVDMILDTFPFNGGTTTCWATYAGVPVLTISGESLASCMGKSIMCNLGFPQFVVNSVESYVDAAVRFATFTDDVDSFRKHARARFLESSLGNGKKYTLEFEKACEQILSGEIDVPVPAVPPLPLQEMLRRARIVWYNGNSEAAERIVEQCRIHYGSGPDLEELVLEMLVGRREFEKVNSINDSLEFRSPRIMHWVALAIAASGDVSRADIAVDEILNAKCASHHDSLQRRLWSAWRAEREMKGQVGHGEGECEDLNPPTKFVEFWVVCEGAAVYKDRCVSLAQRIRVPKECSVTYKKIDKYCRAESYNKILGDDAMGDRVVVIIREDLEIINENFLYAALKGLEGVDVLGVAGALRWAQKDWTLDLPAYKAWGLIRPSKLSEGMYELHFAGNCADPVIENAVVLDGKLLMFRTSNVQKIEFDPEMGDSGLWIEEDWCHRLHLAGKKLSIHRGMGVVVNTSDEFENLHTASGQQGLLERINLDPLRLPLVNHEVITIQVSSTESALRVSRKFLRS